MSFELYKYYPLSYKQYNPLIYALFGVNLDEIKFIEVGQEWHKPPSPKNSYRKVLKRYRDQKNSSHRAVNEIKIRYIQQAFEILMKHSGRLGFIEEKGGSSSPVEGQVISSAWAVFEIIALSAIKVLIVYTAIIWPFIRFLIDRLYLKPIPMKNKGIDLLRNLIKERKIENQPLLIVIDGNSLVGKSSFVSLIEKGTSNVKVIHDTYLLSDDEKLISTIQRIKEDPKVSLIIAEGVSSLASLRRYNVIPDIKVLITAEFYTRYPRLFLDGAELDFWWDWIMEVFGDSIFISRIIKSIRSDKEEFDLILDNSYTHRFSRSKNIDLLSLSSNPINKLRTNNYEPRTSSSSSPLASDQERLKTLGTAAPKDKQGRSLPVEVHIGTFRGISYFVISNILERNLRERSKPLKILRPRSPDTALWGGILRQATSTFLITNPKNSSFGTITTGTYSIPLAVIISILFLGLAGSQPMAMAVSAGIVVMLAPVSSTILSIFASRLPAKRAGSTITPDFISNGSLAIAQLKGYGIAGGQFILRIINVGKSLISDRFSVYLIAIKAMGNETTANGRGSGRIEVVYLNQKPLVMEFLANIFDFLATHFDFLLNESKYTIVESGRQVALLITVRERVMIKENPASSPLGLKAVHPEIRIPETRKSGKQVIRDILENYRIPGYPDAQITAYSFITRSSSPVGNTPACRSGRDEHRLKKQISTDKISSPIKKNNSQDLPKYGDADFWPGTMQVSPEVLRDLGMSQGWGRHERLIMENLIPEFAKVNAKVKHILKRRLASPYRNHRDIMRERQSLQALLNMISDSNASNPLEAILKLIENYNRIVRDYYTQLETLRYYHYPWWRKGKPLEYDELYPDVAPALISLGELIFTLVEIEKHLPTDTAIVITKWKKRIQDILRRQEIQPFLKRERLLAWNLNPYCFVDKDVLIRQKGRKKADWEINHALRLEERLKEKGIFESISSEYFSLMDELSDLWLLSSLSQNKHKRQLKKTQGINSLGDKHAFLRQFPDGMIVNPLAEMEYYIRMAFYAKESGYQFANIQTPTGNVKLTSYSNPLLVQRNTDGKIINRIIQPIAINLDKRNNTLLLSGPNMGGKTTTARGIGVAVLLNQMGFLIPDDNAELAVFKNIYTLFPQPEQLKPGFGYFGMLIEKLTDLIKVAGRGDLILLDEVPAGTDYYELVAVATVLIEDLINSGATVVVTSHLKQCFALLQQRTGCQPYMHTVKQDNGRLVPDFQLAPGIAKQSYAIELMEEAGFPDEIVQLARSYYRVITEGGDMENTPPVAKFNPVQTPKNSLNNKLASFRMFEVVVDNIYPRRNFVFSESRDRIINSFTNCRDTTKSASGYSLYFSTVDSLENQKKKKVLTTPGTDANKFTAAEKRLYLTEFFLKQGLPYLNKLSELLNEIDDGHFDRSPFYAQYDPVSNKQKLDGLEKMLRVVIEYIKPLKQESLLLDSLGDLEESLNRIIQLRKDFTKDAKTLDEEEKKGLNLAWEKSWRDLVDFAMTPIQFLDIFTGIARSVIEHKLVAPAFSKKPKTFNLKNSRPFYPNRSYFGKGKPFLEDAIKQSLKVNPDKPVLILTGPNSSGKSVLMFHCYAEALLAMNGYYVSEDLEMSEFDSIHAFFGGENSTDSGESYFLNILNQYAEIINQVTPNSLLILDEMHGTDNFELAAIQLAVLHYLRQINATVIFNTHIRDGLKIAAEEVGLDLWKTEVTYDAEKNTVKPRFTISPDPNLEAKSYGLAIASQWLSEEQSARAKKIMEEIYSEQNAPRNTPDEKSASSPLGLEAVHPEIRIPETRKSGKQVIRDILENYRIPGYPDTQITAYSFITRSSSPVEADKDNELNKFDRIKWIEAEVGETGFKRVREGLPLKAPLQIEVHPYHYIQSKPCSNNCLWCTRGMDKFALLRAKAEGIDPDRLISFIKGFKGFGITEFALAGNSTEPLLYPKIEDVIKEIKEIGSTLRLYSNFYYGERLVLVAGVLGKGDVIRISLDAGSPESYNTTHRPDDKDAFNKIIRNISALLVSRANGDLKFDVFISYLLNALNSSKTELGFIVNWAVDKGIDIIRFALPLNPLDHNTPYYPLTEAGFDSVKEIIADLRERNKGYRTKIVLATATPQQTGKPFKACHYWKMAAILGSWGKFFPCTATATKDYANILGVEGINSPNFDFWKFWNDATKWVNINIAECPECTRAEFKFNSKVEGRSEASSPVGVSRNTSHVPGHTSKRATCNVIRETQNTSSPVENNNLQEGYFSHNSLGQKELSGNGADSRF